MVKDTKESSENRNHSSVKRIANIREVIEGDFDRITAIERKCFISPWSRKAFEKLFQQKHVKGFVAGLENLTVGYIWTLSVLDELEILNVAVDPNYQGIGVGHFLFSTVHEYYQKRGVSRCFLEVRMSNQKAQRFYQRLGYRSLSVRKNYYEDTQEDALVMTLHF